MQLFMEFVIKRVRLSKKGGKPSTPAFPPIPVSPSRA